MGRSWIAQRTRAFDSSGIRKIFDLAGTMTDPVNLSIGQPDYDVPAPVRQAMHDAIDAGRNGYSVTQGIAPLRERLAAELRRDYAHADREVFVTSGTSGALTLVMMALIDPGDEVVFFDPYFVMYPSLVRMAGGTPVPVDCGPGLELDVDAVERVLTPRTKMIVVNSPANPTGVLASEESLRRLARLAEERDLALVSDEIYRAFCYDRPFVSPAHFNPSTIVIDGFSKSHAMTGWRLGFVHGPKEVMDTMLKLQQYTFVCAPQPVQWAGLAALETPVQDHVDAYRAKRDRLYEGIRDRYDVVKPGGAFYMYPKAPGGSGTAFVTRAIEAGLLVIPGSIFSRHDTHFRISYAADDRTLDRGIEILRSLA